MIKGSYNNYVSTGVAANLERVVINTLEEKTVLNDYATTTKTVYNDSFLVVFQSLWTVLVIVA
jgi:hypothetical protein